MLSCQDHRCLTVQATDVDYLGGPDACAAARADILAAAAFLGKRAACGGCAAVGACAADMEAAVFIPVDEDIREAIGQNEVQKSIRRACVAPSIFVAVGDCQAVGFRCCLKPLVVVGVASAAILDALLIVVIVDHFVEKGSGYFLNGSCQSASAYIDFVGAAQLGNPGIFLQGEMAVGSGSGLDGDGGS